MLILYLWIRSRYSRGETFNSVRKTLNPSRGTMLTREAARVPYVWRSSSDEQEQHRLDDTHPDSMLAGCSSLCFHTQLKSVQIRSTYQVKITIPCTGSFLLCRVSFAASLSQPLLRHRMRHDRSLALAQRSSSKLQCKNNKQLHKWPLLLLDLLNQYSAGAGWVREAFERCCAPAERPSSGGDDLDDFGKTRRVTHQMVWGPGSDVTEDWATHLKGHSDSTFALADELKRVF